MEEATNTDVSEVVVPEAENQVSESQQENMEKESKRNSQEYNFRELRRVTEIQQQEIQELRQRLEAQAAPTQQEEDLDLPDDEIPTMGQIKKVIAKQAEAKAKELFEKEKQASEQSSLKTKYPDFDDVVSPENVDELLRDDEELKATLKKSFEQNPTRASIMAYNLIKKSKFYHDAQAVPAKKQSTAIQEKAQKNLSKPVSSAALGQTTPIQNAMNFSQLSKEEKANIYKDMQRAASRR